MILWKIPCNIYFNLIDIIDSTFAIFLRRQDECLIDDIDQHTVIRVAQCTNLLRCIYRYGLFILKLKSIYINISSIENVVIVLFCVCVGLGFVIQLCKKKKKKKLKCNPCYSGQFSLLLISTDISKNWPIASLKYYLLSILNTILFCRLLFIIRIKLIFFFYLCKNYTKLADVVKTDAHEGNSRQHSYLLSKWPEKLVSR